LTGKASNSIPISIRPADRRPDSLGAALMHSYALVDSLLAGTSEAGASRESVLVLWRSLEAGLGALIADGIVDTTSSGRMIGLVDTLKVGEAVAARRRTTEGAVTAAALGARAESDDCKECQRIEALVTASYEMCKTAAGAVEAGCRVLCLSCKL